MENNKDFIIAKLQCDAYERFKLHWMIHHGYTIHDLLDKYSEYWGEVEADEEGMCDFWDFLEETGFGGELWPCFNEFLDTEWREEALMQSILSTEQYHLYKTYVLGNSGEEG